MSIIPMWRRTIPALAVLLAITLAAPAQADRRRWVPEAETHGFAPHSAAERRVSIEQAIARVQRETGGRVLDARDLGDQYRIKVLTRSGEVRIVYVDAATGRTR